MWVSYDLNDSFDISSRIKKENQTMGALTFRIFNIHGYSFESFTMGQRDFGCHESCNAKISAAAKTSGY